MMDITARNQRAKISAEMAVDAFGRLKTGDVSMTSSFPFSFSFSVFLFFFSRF